MKITPTEGDFQARSRFAHSNIPEEKWGTTGSLTFVGEITTTTTTIADSYPVSSTVYSLLTDI